MKNLAVGFWDKRDGGRVGDREPQQLLLKFFFSSLINVLVLMTTRGAETLQTPQSRQWTLQYGY